MIYVCYCADEKYSVQVGVSMISMLENNLYKEFEFFVLSNNYSTNTRNKFKEIEDKYHCKINILDITSKMDLLLNTVLSEENGIIRNGTISFMFARLFIGSSIPDNVDKLIYIDSDTLYVNDIDELYKIEIQPDYLFAAVRDLWPVRYNKVIGYAEDDLYFQSGIMLVDLKQWREKDCEKIILEHIFTLKRYYPMHDQDILNICFKGKIQTLPVKFGMVYLLRKYKAKQVILFSGKSEEHYYTEQEIEDAKKNTHVIHYAGDYFGRPWVFPKACGDSRIWYRYYMLSPWRMQSLAKEYHPKYNLKFFMKKMIYPMTSTLWLKRIHRRFLREIDMLIAQMSK